MLAVVLTCRGDGLKGPWSARSARSAATQQERTGATKLTLDRQLGIFALGVYQKIISPHLGTNCQFYPSCSEYCKQAVIKYGFFNGWLMGLERLTRCNRWARGSNYSVIETGGSRKLSDYPEDNVVPRKNKR